MDWSLLIRWTPGAFSNMIQIHKPLDHQVRQPHDVQQWRAWVHERRRCREKKHQPYSAQNEGGRLRVMSPPFFPAMLPSGRRVSLYHWVHGYRGPKGGDWLKKLLCGWEQVVMELVGLCKHVISCQSVPVVSKVMLQGSTVYQGFFCQVISRLVYLWPDSVLNFLLGVEFLYLTILIQYLDCMDTSTLSFF